MWVLNRAAVLWWLQLEEPIKHLTLFDTIT